MIWLSLSFPEVVKRQPEPLMETHTDTSTRAPGQPAAAEVSEHAMKDFFFKVDFIQNCNTTQWVPV